MGFDAGRPARSWKRIPSAAAKLFSALTAATAFFLFELIFVSF